LQTLGSVLKAQGYEPLFVYGGYSYFDNMQDFFGGNGYRVIDRSALSKSKISHETVWGVADEAFSSCSCARLMRVSLPIKKSLLTS
jgi:phosphoglycerol transferase MdoB-like AlkP superfamily enzyme